MYVAIAAVLYLLLECWSIGPVARRRPAERDIFPHPVGRWRHGPRDRKRTASRSTRPVQCSPEQATGSGSGEIRPLPVDTGRWVRRRAPGGRWTCRRHTPRRWRRRGHVVRPRYIRYSVDRAVRRRLCTCDGVVAAWPCKDASQLKSASAIYKYCFFYILNSNISFKTGSIQCESKNCTH